MLRRTPMAAMVIFFTLYGATPASAMSEAPPEVPKWQVYEISLTASMSPSNPFTDTRLKATVTPPHGAPFMVDGFFDGDGKGGQDGKVWKLRFSPNTIGFWQWTTHSNDPGLNDRHGRFRCLESGDPGPVEARGRYFHRIDGAPVYLMGNFLDLAVPPREQYSHTLLSEKITEKNRQDMILRQRRVHRANKINVYLANRGDYGGISTTPWVGGADSPDRTRFDLKRWAMYDRIIAQLKDEGMVAELWFFADDSGFGDLPDADRQRLIEYAMARLSAYPHTMFILCLEWQEGWSVSEVSSHMTYMQAHNPWGRLCSVHGIDADGGDFAFPREAWADFMATQPGNAIGPKDNNAHVIRNRAFADEPLLVEEFGHLNDSTRKRLRGNLWACFCGGAAGSGTGSGLARLRAFIEDSDVAFWDMAPDNSLTSKGFALANPGREYVIYLEVGGTFTVQLAEGTYQAHWFCPRRDPGDAAPVSIAEVHGGARAFTTPDKEDWVLHIKNVVPADPAGTVPVYGTFELEIPHPGVTGNRFARFATVTFTKGARRFSVEGFYDGDDTWRARFMPDEEGLWNFTWSLMDRNGAGSFVCKGAPAPKQHGHVKRDPKHPRYLVYDDGLPHYWFGGKWISGVNYRPLGGGGKKGEVPQPHESRYTDGQLLAYLDAAAARKHNGLLLKMALFPLEDDRFSWDLAWIHRGEWLVREMAKRGIYCQINFFDTWSRALGKPFDIDTNGNRQVFNVWKAGDEAAKENYIRTVVARFSGFYNVYWELGNEMEHAPNDGNAFVALANEHYLPWIRKYDPYGLPIGVSEERMWQGTSVDIGFLHQTSRLPKPTTAYDRPTIINELVFGWDGGELYEDGTIRNPANRLGYRRTFWRMFTLGGCGSTEATWLNIATPLNEAVLTVMDDQARLRALLEALPVSINEMDTQAGFVHSGPGKHWTRGKAGACYVTYFLLEPEQSTGAGTVSLSLPDGVYRMRWYDPKTGTYTPGKNVQGGDQGDFPHPAFQEDVVLVLDCRGTGE